MSGNAPASQRAQVVDDVLDEGEPHPDQRAVDQSVEQPVDLGAPEDHHDDEEQALAGLLDERRDDRGVDEGGGSGQREQQTLGDQAEGHRHHAAPAERRQPVAGRLRLVAVQPEQDQDQQREGDRGQQGGDQGGDGAAGEHDQHRDRQRPRDRGRPSSPRSAVSAAGEAARAASGARQGTRTARPGPWRVRSSVTLLVWLGRIPRYSRRYARAA